MIIVKGTRVFGKMDMTYNEAHALSQGNLIGRVFAAIWNGDGANNTARG
jgi:hypothetical protein